MSVECLDEGAEISETEKMERRLLGGRHGNFRGGQITTSTRAGRKLRRAGRRHNWA